MMLLPLKWVCRENDKKCYSPVTKTQKYGKINCYKTKYRTLQMHRCVQIYVLRNVHFHNTVLFPFGYTILTAVLLME